MANYEDRERRKMHEMVILENEKTGGKLKAMIEKIQSKGWKIHIINKPENFQRIISKERKVPEIVLINTKRKNEDEFLFLGIYPVCFLTEPIDENNLEKALEKVQVYVRKYSEKEIVVNVGKKLIKIKVEDIVYVESEKRKVKIITIDEKYEVYMKLNDLLPERFQRIYSLS